MLTQAALGARGEAVSAKTCGNCKHLGCLPPPRMSKHKVPRVLMNYPGRCRCQSVLPMVSKGETYRVAAWADTDATKCLCWEPKP